MRVMSGAFLFIAGIAVGLAVEAGVAQSLSPNKGIVGLNHVCIVVPNLDEAVNYYTKTLGFPEAFRSKDDKGNVTLVYVQISKNTSSNYSRRIRRDRQGSITLVSLWMTCRRRRQCSRRGARRLRVFARARQRQS